MRRRRTRRVRMGRAIVLVPNIFTLANLFFGVWSIVLASREQFYLASWWIVIAGVLDLMDGLFARMSKTDTRFGAELDSLVDMVSFGLAPAVLLYFVHFSAQGQFGWVFLYGFVVCAALRLARYNVHPAEGPRTGFTGLPCPAAGATLAVYYPYTQTGFYQTQLASLPWNEILIFLTIALSLAMVSNIHYARLPRIGVRTLSGLLGLAINLTILSFAIWSRDTFFFPLGITYLVYGIARAAVMGFLERGEDELEAEPSAEPLGPFVVRDEDSATGPSRRKPPAQG